MASSDAGMPFLGSIISGDLLPVGQPFGSYAIEACLGGTLLGMQYRARRYVDGNQVGLLVLPRHLSDREAHLKALSKRLQTLSHAGAQRLFAVEKVDGRLVAVGELMPGEALAGRVLTEPADPAAPSGGSGPLGSVATACGWDAETLLTRLCQVAQAIAQMHGEGILHLAFVPANLYPSEKSGLRLTGAGLYQLCGRQTFEHLISRAVPPVRGGSEAQRPLLDLKDVISPEWRAGGDPGARADVYAWGATAYFLLTGHKPGAQRRPASSLCPGLPELWDTLLDRCLEHQPADRFATMAALAARVEDALAGRAERPQRATARTSRLSGRTRTLLRLGGLAALGLLTLGIGRESLFTLLQGEARSNLSPVRVTAEGRAPDLLLRVSPPGAYVTFPGLPEARRFTVTGPELALDLPAGTHVVRVEAANHEPWQQPVQVAGDTQDVAAQLVPAWSQAVLRTVPGARVEIIGERGAERFLALADARGELALAKRLFARAYRLRLSRDGYEPRELALDLAGAKAGAVIEVDLEAHPGVLVLTSQPSGAAVYFEGRFLGRTPLETSDLPAGAPVTLTLRYPDFEDTTRTVEIEPGGRTVIETGPLARLLGRVRLQLPDLAKWLRPEERAELSLLVGGERFRGSLSANELQLPVGRHQLALAHPLLEVKEVTVHPHVDEVTPVELPVVLRPGWLALKGVAEGVRLLVDGEPVEAREGRYPLPARREVSVQVQARDHLTARRAFEVEPNEEVAWELENVRIPPPERGKAFTVPYLGVKLQWVRRGSVQLGSPEDELERRPNEGPRTQVTFSQGFWAGAREITQEQFEALMGRNPAAFKGANRPVEQVTWAEAMAYCERLTEAEGKAHRLPEGFVYRLPTQAEWEYLCRAGTRTPFSFGDAADNTAGNFVGTYPRTSAKVVNVSGGKDYGTKPVGSYAANRWGLHDMHGNVREWCLDPFNERLPGGALRDWQGETTGHDRPVRGGGWQDFAHRCRSAARERLDPETRSAAVGFRVVLAPAMDASP